MLSCAESKDGVVFLDVVLIREAGEQVLNDSDILLRGGDAERLLQVRELQGRAGGGRKGSGGRVRAAGDAQCVSKP